MSSSVSRRLVVFAVVLLLGILAGAILLRRPDSAPAPAPVADAPAAPRSPADAPAKAASVASVDLRPALEAARTSRQPVQRAREFGRLLQEWIVRDPEAALAYVRSLGSGAEYTQGLFMVLTAIGRSDPDRALALARELVMTREQRAVYSVLFAQMASANPASAAIRLAQVPPGESRDYAVRALADGWARADLAASLAWARQLGPEERSPAVETVLAVMQASDPLQAADVALATLSGAALERTLVSSVHALVRSDLPTAAALVVRFPEGDAQNQAMFPVVRALAALNPVEAVAWSKTLPAGPTQAMALNNILDVWAAQAPAAAGQFVAQMNPGPAQEAAAGYVVALLAANPPAAIQWVQSLPNGAARDRASVNLASAWAQRDPAAAAAWSATLPSSPEVRMQALHAALSYWLERDSGAAGEFVAGLAGGTQAEAAAYVAPGLAQRDPEAAIAWTQTLSAAGAREAALAAAYARWLQNAPVAAKTWLAQANLPAATKARLGGPP
jgi:hypothetical protein